ncbi:MAG: CHAP domain-containing protein [Alphaproteobacteria bacterium]|nr:CHAP domain-containing protein [Alphaproteobacteria bacterium]
MIIRPRVVGAVFSFVCLGGIGVMFFTAQALRTGPALGSAQARAAAPEASAPPVETATPVAAVDGAATEAATLTAVAQTIPTNAAAPQVLRDGPPLQCAIYARQRTGVSLTGAARTWWGQAEGRYRRSHTPEVGAVMAMLGTSAGHVAVVSRVINTREILIDHANWLGGGEIIIGAQAVDVSEANDWSAVRVWHPPTNALGLRPYPVQGFIHPT